MLSEILPRRQILIFHGVGPLPARPVEAGEARYWSAEDTLRRAVALAAADPDIEITFDDGNLSDLRVAAPLLAERGLTARFFVLAGRIGWKEFLSAADIRELDRMGMTIGSHGMDHAHWPALDDAALNRELAGSKAILEGILGKPVQEAAVPFGDFDGRTLRASMAAGYRRIYTSSGGLASRGMRIVPRTSVAGDDFTVLGAKHRLVSGLRNQARLLKHFVNGYARP
ncbi:polysaccharide deacetylase family protein [Roseococcus sp. YIM B11640]|uniref:polysaccharide deacetylase family protein n=1 Tax=Roseococcus sp. YIM B11640 TaxID=3133973 RepID=UPI003C7A2019